MSKDKDFHKLIEKQDEEKKNLVWRKIQTQTTNDESNLNVENVGEVIALSKNKSKRNFILSAAISALIIIGLILGLLLGFNRKPDDFSNSPNDEIRYCTIDDYYIDKTDINIEKYNEENDLNLLYFDYYDKTEYYADAHYKLNNTDEVICLFEEIYDDNFAYINIYITDNKTDIDAIKFIKNASNKQTEVKSIKVNFGLDLNILCAHFEYNGYLYYLSVEYEQSEEQYIINLIDKLLARNR